VCLLCIGNLFHGVLLRSRYFCPQQPSNNTAASWLVRSSPERAVRVPALAEDTVVFLGNTLNSHSASLHPGDRGNLTNCGGMTCDGLASRPRGVEILLAASCYRNQGNKISEFLFVNVSVMWTSIRIVFRAFDFYQAKIFTET